MSKRNPNRAYIGDFVEIINPQFFIRCGYPLTTSMIYDSLFVKNGEAE